MSVPDLVFVSMENWDDVWRRNQFLCAGLARRHPNMKILFMGRPRDVSHQIRKRKFAEVRGRASYPAPGHPAITITHPLKLLPNTLAAGRKVNEALERAHIRKEMRRMGMERPLLWLNPHYAVHMCGKMGERGVVYDITDDWTSLSQSAWLRELVQRQDAELCRRADEVIVCSQRLYEMKEPLARSLHLVPNGVDVEHYRAAGDRANAPEAARQWPRPVLGYTGSIHPDRVDVDLVAELAERFSAGTVALVGPNMLPADEVQRLGKQGNVVITGPVPYAEVPSYMAAFDVCITPHQMTPFTESLNPIKLWEYLAAGKPIVSTDVAGFRDYPEVVRTARDADGFAAAVGEALAEPQAVRVKRQALARENSWDARLDDVEQVLGRFLEREVAGAAAV